MIRRTQPLPDSGHTRARPRYRLPSATLFLTLFALPVLGSCGSDGPTEPSVDGLTVMEIILSGDDGSFIFSHRDHWHGAPVVNEGETAAFTIYLSALRLPADDHDIPPFESWFTLEEHTEYSLQAIVEDPTIGVWQGGRVQGALHGLKDGASRMTFVVRRGTTTIYEAPPLNFRVRTPE